MPLAAPALLLAWIERQTQEPGRAWLREALALARSGEMVGILAAFSLAARRLGKDYLMLAPQDLEHATKAHPGWKPTNWTMEQGARALLLLHARMPNPELYHELVDTLFHAGDVREQVALLKVLPLLPEAASCIDLACEGVRSNAGAVLQAIAFDNPYPALHFSLPQWNALVLKCLFLDIGVERIEGLGRRLNPELVRMAQDLCRERLAAKRPLPPGIERILGGSREAAREESDVAA